MIVKKVASKGGQNQATGIRAMTKYISRKGQLPIETRGFVFSDKTNEIEQVTDEMIVLASQAPRSKNACQHWLISWSEGEEPTQDQIAEAVDIWQKEMGWAGHQLIYVVHDDTANVHVHLIINRVSPETGKIVKPEGRYDIEPAHRAIARIEALQGWKSEEHSRYQIDKKGKVVRTQQQIQQPSGKSQDYETRTGAKSIQRQIMEAVKQVLPSVRTWSELHEKLAEKGILYAKKGSGAVFLMNGFEFKASSIERKASLSTLVKRFGPYHESQENLTDTKAKNTEITTQHNVPLLSAKRQPRWHEYRKKRETYFTEKKKAQAAIQEQIKKERQQLRIKQKNERNEKLAGSWKGKGKELNALRSVLAAQQAAEQAEQRDRHKLLWHQHRDKWNGFLNYEDWLRAEEGDDDAEAWRYHRHNVIIGPTELQLEIPQPLDIRAYRAEISGAYVYYSSEEHKHAFVDRGKIISINEIDKDVVLAALQLSAKKWGQFTVFGCDEYIDICIDLAAEHGFRITNPELQDRINERKEQIKNKPVAKQEQQQNNTEIQEDVVQTDEERVNDLRLFVKEAKRTLKEIIEILDDTKNSSSDEDRRKIVYSHLKDIEPDNSTIESIMNFILNEGEKDIDTIVNSIYKDIIDEAMELSRKIQQKKLKKLREERAEKKSQK